MVMDFVSPMLASPMPAKLSVEPGQWVVEEKFDGHRLIVAVGAYVSDLFGRKSVFAYSRNGLKRELPVHLEDTLRSLPEGIYDGELIAPGGRSYGVTELSNADHLVYVVFDVLFLRNHVRLDNWPPDGDPRGELGYVNEWPYSERRDTLQLIFQRCFGPNHNGDYPGPNDQGCENPACFKYTGHTSIVDGHARPYKVRLAEAIPVSSLDQVQDAANAVWARDGEGLILKRLSSTYQINKRSKDWIKVKKLRSAVVTVVGYREGKLGPHSTLLVRDDDGNETVVKWKSLADLAMLDADPQSFLGRRLRIEYQERTPSGSYRHPRWDRWEDE